MNDMKYLSDTWGLNLNRDYGDFGWCPPSIPRNFIIIMVQTCRDLYFEYKSRDRRNSHTYARQDSKSIFDLGLSWVWCDNCLSWNSRTHLSYYRHNTWTVIEPLFDQGTCIMPVYEYELEFHQVHEDYSQPVHQRDITIRICLNIRFGAVCVWCTLRVSRVPGCRIVTSWKPGNKHDTNNVHAQIIMAIESIFDSWPWLIGVLWHYFHLSVSCGPGLRHKSNYN
jgi:hypothetical protein